VLTGQADLRRRRAFGSPARNLDASDFVLDSVTDNEPDLNLAEDGIVERSLHRGA
jgi:hypothetical protein